MILDYDSKKSDYLIVPSKIMRNIITKLENRKIKNYFNLFLIEDYSKNKILQNDCDKIILENSVNYLHNMVFSNKYEKDSKNRYLILKKYYYKILLERLFIADYDCLKKIFEVFDKE